MRRATLQLLLLPYLVRIRRVAPGLVTPAIIANTRGKPPASPSGAYIARLICVWCFLVLRAFIYHQ
ncbi:hypothetical protein KCP69_10080 [Salmonella enterica subsp. enterica]|nr:hypothetical protein KCP69_10080 [Salmonella enterica subsp. enterica]